MENLCTSRKWTTTFDVITLSDSDFPRVKLFSCSVCNENLSGKEVFVRDSQKYCSECFETIWGQKCFHCRKSISGLARMTFVYYDNQTWHIGCFKCTSCKNSLVGSTKEGTCIHCSHCGAHVKFCGIF